MKKLIYSSMLAILCFGSSSMLHASSQDKQVIDSFFGELYYIAFSKALLANATTAQQKQCVQQEGRDHIESLASTLAMQKLSAKERQLFAEFLNTPFGSDVYASLLQGDLELKNLNKADYDASQYRKYEPIIRKTMNKNVLFDEHMKKDMARTVLQVMLICDILPE